MRQQLASALHAVHRRILLIIAASTLLLASGCMLESEKPLLAEHKFSKAPAISGYFYNNKEIALIKPVDAQVVMFATSKGTEIFELRFVRFPQSDIYIIQAVGKDPKTNTRGNYKYFGAYIPADGSGFSMLTIDGDAIKDINQRFALKRVLLSYLPPAAPASFDVIDYFFEVHARLGWENVRSVEYQRVSEQAAERIMARQAAEDQERQAEEERNARPRYGNGRKAEPRPRQ